MLLPQAAGGRLYSDKMGRIAFLQLLIFSMPIGIHHLFADPQIGAGFKFLHAVFTGMVAVPTLLTIFTICASLEIAGRLRGGRGLFGWVAALPWDRPFVLASAFSLLMLGLGGASGLINMSYALNSTVHNTQWVTGHFHLIYGGAIVIMYFAIAYELWPRLTGRPLASPKLVRLQLWTWFGGMLIVTLPWHLVGVMGQPRRMAYYDFTDPALAPQAIWVSVSAIGGFVLVVSAMLLVGVLLASHRGPNAAISPLKFSLAINPPRRLPGSLNSLAIWTLLMVALTVANYGYPLAQFLFLDSTRVPAYSRSSTMTIRDQPTSPDSRFAVWIGATVALFVVAVLIGFVWLPSAQRGADGLDLWSAICRAIGLPNASARASAPLAAQPASTVAWTAATRRRLAQGNAVRGAALATTCNNCHGANGISTDAAFPNLTGQSADAIYKQLEDYRSGKRNPAVMGVFVSPLSEQDILDLAAHFASLPNPFAGGLGQDSVPPTRPRAI